MSHIDPKVKKMIIKSISKHVGDLVITRGKNNTVLGTDIDILYYNKRAICIESYIHEAVDYFDENVSTKVSYQANTYMNKVNPDLLTLPNNQAEDFHSVVANIYGKLNKKYDILKMLLLLFILELSHQQNKTNINSRYCYSF